MMDYVIDYEKTGKLIQEARKEQKLTQLQLAQLLGVTDRAVSKWETGKSFPDVAMLKPLAETLNLTVGEILEGERKLCEDAALYVNNAAYDVTEETAIRGIHTYINKTRKKERKKLYIVLALLLVMFFALGMAKLAEYRTRPLDFKKDELDFGALSYCKADEGDSKVQRFELADKRGEETRKQIEAFLRNTEVWEQEKYEEYKGKNAMVGVRGGESYVELEKLVTIYKRAYYDHRSEKYYFIGHNDSCTLWEGILGFCESQLEDIDYKYTGDKLFSNGQRTLRVECELTEKPMEAIVDFFVRDMEELDSNISWEIKSIRRMNPEEYKNLYEFERFLSKEVPYRDIIEYRCYEVEIYLDFIDEEKAIGAQYPEGMYKIVAAPSKSVFSGGFDVIFEYILTWL